MMTSRRKGVDLNDKDASALLNGHVSLASCKPKSLFKVTKIDKNGCTSSWSDIKANYQFVSELLDLSRGYAIKAKRFTDQLDQFLRSHGMVWCRDDLDSAVKCLKAMLSTLGVMSRPPTEGCLAKRPPRTYESLMALSNKMCPAEFAPGVEEVMVGFPKTVKLSNFQIFKLSNLQTFKLSNFETFKLSNFKTFKLSNFQTYKLPNFQIVQTFNL